MFNFKDLTKSTNEEVFNPQNNPKQGSREDWSRFWDMWKEFKTSDFEDIKKREALYKYIITFLKQYKWNPNNKYGSFFQKILNAEFKEGKIIFDEEDK